MQFQLGDHECGVAAGVSVYESSLIAALPERDPIRAMEDSNAAGQGRILFINIECRFLN